MIVACIFARLRIASEVRMALRTEPVEGATHIEFLFCRHIEECQIDRTATGMATPLVDILLFEEQNAIVVPPKDRTMATSIIIFCFISYPRYFIRMRAWPESWSLVMLFSRI